MNNTGPRSTSLSFADHRLHKRQSNRASANEAGSAISDTKNTHGTASAPPPLTLLQGNFRRNRGSTAGFLPLPPIASSPICSPATSMASMSMWSGSNAAESTESFTTAPATPLDPETPSSRSPYPLKVATLSSSPPKLVRRSVTCVIRRPRSPSHPASKRTPSHLRTQLNGARPRRPYRSVSDPLLSSRAVKSLHLPSTFNDMIVSPVKNGDSPSPTTPKTHKTFEITHVVATDHDDVAPKLVALGVEELDQSERKKEDLRKFHALSELLTTEVQYVTDLRVLFDAYLSHLHSLTSRPSNTRTTGTPAPFNALSRKPSESQHLTDSQSSPHIELRSDYMPVESDFAKEKDKGQPQPLLSPHDFNLLRRNAKQILELHETFVLSLASVTWSYGCDIRAFVEEKVLENIDEMTSAVAAKFATQASRFKIYGSFCAGHQEALQIVKRLQQSYSHEWAIFEKECAARIPCTLEFLKVEPNETMDDKRRRRSRSVTSIELGRSIGTKHAPQASSLDLRKQNARFLGHRLTFLDYLIKPVQRICKYPLLLDQLIAKDSQSTLGKEGDSRVDANVVVDSAATAMRTVASAVNEEKKQQDVTLQTSLIISRISTILPTPQIMSQGHTANRDLRQLTPSFLSSLGPCLLAGPLDVFKPVSYYGSHIKAKYLGAFLYPGGYLILVKVAKSKIYEPRHWFRLSSFQLSVSSGDDLLTPFSFRLSGTGHQLEFAASCEAEKDIWVASIQNSLNHVPQWINEPIPSLGVRAKGDAIDIIPDSAPLQDIISSPLPIEVDGQGEQRLPLTESLVAAFEANGKDRKRTNTNDSHTESFRTPSRRSSTTSVRAIFAPLSSVTLDSDGILVHRASSTVRSTVDAGLLDVISENLLLVRPLGGKKNEEFLHNAKSARRPMSRSGTLRSNISLADDSKVSDDERTQQLQIHVRSKTFSGRRSKQNLVAVPAIVPPRLTSLNGDTPAGHGYIAPSPQSAPLLTVDNPSLRDLPLDTAVHTAEPYQAMDTRKSIRPFENVMAFFGSRDHSSSRSFVSDEVQIEKKGSLRRWAKTIRTPLRRVNGAFGMDCDNEQSRLSSIQT